MKSSPDPECLDVKALARAGQTLSGRTPVSHRERLQAERAPTEAGYEPAPEPHIDWSIRGEWRERLGAAAQCWLHVQAQLTLPLVCQRCLGPVGVPLEVNRPFRFVADEATAEREDESAEEDVLVLSPQFDVLELIDDELLMALPLVPRHEPECPSPVQLTVQDPAFDDGGAQGRPHPFAVLARLKQGPREG